MNITNILAILNIVCFLAFPTLSWHSTTDSNIITDKSGFIYKTDISTYAKVNKYGKITMVEPDKTVIMAKTSENTLKCNVKVSKRNKKNCLSVICSKYVRSEMSDYEKIYAAHAWIIQNVKYDKRLYTKGTVPAVSHYAEGVFNKGVAVCDGYSKAFMAIMEHYNIPCKMVTGGYHAWNIVKIKNKWYHIDCTFDDPIVNGKFNNKKIYMDFFLKTDKYMKRTHKWDYTAFPKCTSKKPNKKYKTERNVYIYDTGRSKKIT